MGGREGFDCEENSGKRRGEMKISPKVLEEETSQPFIKIGPLRLSYEETLGESYEERMQNLKLYIL